MYDKFGMERGTEYGLEQVYNVVDSLLEMCSPVCFTGENFRKATAREKMKRLKMMIGRKESL